MNDPKWLLQRQPLLFPFTPLSVIQCINGGRGGFQHIETMSPLCFAGREGMRYVGWEGLMVAWLIVERVTLSRCFQTDVQGEDSGSGNNEFSMQDNCSDCMVLWGVTTTDFSEFSGFLPLRLKQ